MAETPDIHHDVDALFEHITTHLGHEMGDEKEWHFVLRSEDYQHLKKIGESLSDEFDIDLQESVETHEEDRTFMGPPLMAIVIVASLTPDEVKSLVTRFKGLAEEQALTYEGVSCYDPIDMDEMFGWLDLEAAAWRLRAYTDSGLAPGERVPFVFAIETDDRAGADAIATALAGAGLERVEVIDDEEQGTGLLVYVEGRNDEDLLKQEYGKVERFAAGAGGELVGVQFLEEDSEEDENSD